MGKHENTNLSSFLHSLKRSTSLEKKWVALFFSVNFILSFCCCCYVCAWFECFREQYFSRGQQLGFINDRTEKLPLWAFCQANAEHNKARLFPLPVGLSNKQFWRLSSPLTICKRLMWQNCFALSKTVDRKWLDHDAYLVHHWELWWVRFHREMYLHPTNGQSLFRCGRSHLLMLFVRFTFSSSLQEISCRCHLFSNVGYHFTEGRHPVLWCTAFIRS